VAALDEGVARTASERGLAPRQLRETPCSRGPGSRHTRETRRSLP
jgi:hypothetical protein